MCSKHAWKEGMMMSALQAWGVYMCTSCSQTSLTQHVNCIGLSNVLLVLL